MEIGNKGDSVDLENQIGSKNFIINMAIWFDKIGRKHN
jgi:hypothetical protein